MEAPTRNFVPLQLRRKPPLKKKDCKSKKKGNLRAQWTDEVLKEAIQAIDDGYTMEEVSIHYSIPRTSLRDHISGKTTSRKMGPAPTLTKEEEEALIHHLEEMVDLGHPLNPSQLKTKVGEMTQSRLTPFKQGIPGNSWLKWFRMRNSHLVLRQPQSLDSKRARALCPSNVQRFYTNLESLYTQYHYEAQSIWNIDESGIQANRNGYTKVFATRGTRNVQVVVPNEREHITILSAISADGGTVPNMYVFKGARARKRYIGLCEEEAIIGMQKRVDGQLPFFIMDGAFFAIIDKKGRFLTFPKAFDGS